MYFFLDKGITEVVYLTSDFFYNFNLTAYMSDIVIILPFTKIKRN